MKYRIVELKNGRYAIYHDVQIWKLHNSMIEREDWDHITTIDTLQEANEMLYYMIEKKQREIYEREGRKIKQVIREEEV